MSILLLREGDVRQLLTMSLALEAVEAATRQQAEGTAINQPRRRLSPKHGVFLHYMAAADTVRDYLGMKIYASGPQGIRFLVPLFRGSTGEPLALIEADYLGQMRTGAASGIATRWLARQDAEKAGIIGTGLQARTQLEAICHVREIRSIRAYGRDPARRTAFGAEMSERLKVPVMAVESAQEAVAGADIVVTATTAKEPVLKGEWLEEGSHINAIGANMALRRELDDQAVSRAGLIVTDSKEQATEEAGDLIQTFAKDPARWASVLELSEIIGKGHPGRSSEKQITLFKSNGIAIWDVVTAGRLYELALDRRVGCSVEFFSL